MSDSFQIISELSPATGPSAVRQSYAQQRLWFLHQLDPGNPQHNILLQIELHGPLIPSYLQQAFALTLDRQAILRTRYGDSVNGPRQWVAFNCAEEILKSVDISGLDETAQTAEIARTADLERARPFNLQQGPVIFAYLFGLHPNRHKLMVNIHHIAFDGRSVEVLFAELAAGYRAACGSSPLPRLPLQYADFSQREPEYLGADAQGKQLAFWREYLANVPQEIHWPQSTSAPLTLAGKPIRFQFETGLLEDFSNEQQQSLFQTLLTLFSVWLYFLCRQDKFLVGTDIHGRALPEVEDLIGFFVNQLPLKCDLSADATLAQLFVRTRRSARQAYGHHRMPFDVLVSALAPDRKRSRAPLFQVKLNYQPYRVTTPVIGDAVLSPIHIEQDLAGFDLVMDLTHSSAGIDVVVEYSAHLFPADAMPRALVLWQRLLREFPALLTESLIGLTDRLDGWDQELQHRQQQALLKKNRSGLLTAKRRPQIPSI